MRCGNARQRLGLRHQALDQRRLRGEGRSGQAKQRQAGQEASAASSRRTFRRSVTGCIAAKLSQPAAAASDAPDQYLISTSRLLPDSAPQASPGRPSIWRTCAPRWLLGKLSNFSVAGSNRTIELVMKSVSQTLSCSST